MSFSEGLIVSLILPNLFRQETHHIKIEIEILPDLFRQETYHI